MMCFIYGNRVKTEHPWFCEAVEPNHEPLLIENLRQVLQQQEERLNDVARLQQETATALATSLAALQLQAETNHGELERRLTEFNARLEEAVDKVGARIALQLAELRIELALQAVKNTSVLAEDLSEASALVKKTGAATQEKVLLADTRRLDGALGQAKQETRLLKLFQEHTLT